jgi:hypothetical protein
MQIAEKQRIIDFPRVRKDCSAAWDGGISNQKQGSNILQKIYMVGSIDIQRRYLLFWSIGGYLWQQSDGTGCTHG